VLGGARGLDTRIRAATNRFWTTTPPGRTNRTFARGLDREQAGEKGLYIGLLPTWGNQVVGASWEKSPPIIFTAAQRPRYGRFLGTRYRSSPNLIWILGGDRDPRGVETVWRAMAGGPTTSVRRSLTSTT